MPFTQSNKTYTITAETMKNYKHTLLAELGLFMWKRKLWWLIPIIIVTIFFAFAAMLGSSPVSPFVYVMI